MVFIFTDCYPGPPPPHPPPPPLLLQSSVLHSSVLQSSILESSVLQISVLQSSVSYRGLSYKAHLSHSSPLTQPLYQPLTQLLHRPLPQPLSPQLLSLHSLSPIASLLSGLLLGLDVATGSGLPVYTPRAKSCFLQSTCFNFANLSYFAN